MSEHTPMTPARLAEIAARAEAATPGPWLVADGADGRPVVYVESGAGAGIVAESVRTEADAQSIAKSRRWVPALLAEVASLRAELDARPTRAEVLREAATEAGEIAEELRGSGGEPAEDREWGAAQVAQRLFDLADEADDADPTPLRWGLDDVAYGDDDSVTILLSDGDLAPYALELDAETAAALRAALAGPAGDTSRAAVLREVQDATVAWLAKKAGEEKSLAWQEEQRRATARARRYWERAELISTLASKAARGAVRVLLDAAPPPPSRAEVLNEAADRVRELRDRHRAAGLRPESRGLTDAIMLLRAIAEGDDEAEAGLTEYTAKASLAERREVQGESAAEFEQRLWGPEGGDRS